jgi:hypothetical protein
VPLVVSSAQSARTQVQPESAIAPNRPSFGHKGFDSPPRLLRRVGHANDDVLFEPTTLRRALR